MYQSYLPHDRGFFSNYPHSSLTPKPLDLTLTLEEIQPCLLGAPCLCQRTGTGLGLIPRETEEVLTSSKQIQVPSPPNFLVTLFHQAPHLSCIPLPYHTFPFHLEVFSNLFLPKKSLFLLPFTTKTFRNSLYSLFLSTSSLLLTPYEKLPFSFDVNDLLLCTFQKSRELCLNHSCAPST